jgi:hypothetical protein|tara:strand:- start:37 stop:273 length:237 start_codon:yes stop_codon:yes gene_type:complete
MDTDYLAQAIESELEEAKANLSYHLFEAKEKMAELEKLIRDHDAEDYAPNALAEMYVARDLTRSLEALRDTFNNRGNL